MNIISKACLAAICLAGLCGCGSYTTPIVSSSQPSAVEQRFDVLWEASQQVLQEYNFTVDRRDRRAAVITTYPLVGQQWFEFWRKDAVTGTDLAESTFQGVTRSVTVHLMPLEEGGKVASYRPKVEVETSRPGGEQVAVTSFIDAYDMLIFPGEEVSSRTKRLILRGQEMAGDEGDHGKVTPVTLGWDPVLADRIARDILKRAANLSSSQRPK